LVSVLRQQPGAAIVPLIGVTLAKAFKMIARREENSGLDPRPAFSFKRDRLRISPGDASWKAMPV
jgi:hypothetical protein